MEQEKYSSRQTDIKPWYEGWNLWIQINPEKKQRQEMQRQDINAML